MSVSYFVSYFVSVGIKSFGIKSGICLLIATVPVHCFSLTFIFHVLLIACYVLSCFVLLLCLILPERYAF